MTGNRSLDEFLGDDEADGPEERGATPAAEHAGAAVATGGTAGEEPGVVIDPSDVEPMVPTYVRSVDGGACAECGRTAEVRWWNETGMVCPNCKAW